MKCSTLIRQFHRLCRFHSSNTTLNRVSSPWYKLRLFLFYIVRLNDRSFLYFIEHAQLENLLKMVEKKKNLYKLFFFTFFFCHFTGWWWQRTFFAIHSRSFIRGWVCDVFTCHRKPRKYRCLCGSILMPPGKLEKWRGVI